MSFLMIRLCLSCCCLFFGNIATVMGHSQPVVKTTIDHENLKKNLNLHEKSYSELVNYYKELTEVLRSTRRNILSIVLNGEKEESLNISSIGPFPIRGNFLPALPKDTSILDVGCATGDNLALMDEAGFNNTTGIDIASGMIQEAKIHQKFNLLHGDILQFSPEKPYDLVYAQAFIHLFPKNTLETVLLKLISLSNRRIYFSTTIHDSPNEGLEQKEEENVYRYRSRYTLSEILTVLRKILDDNPQLSVHYFFLKDPLGKYWINCIIEKNDVKKMFEEDGILIYKQFFAPEKITKVLPEIDALATTIPKPNTIMRYDTETVFDRIENFIPYCSNELRQIASSPKIINTVSLLLNEEVVLFKDKINFKMPGSGAFVPHQDAAAGWDEYGDVHHSVAISFDASNEENGALYFAPGAHKQGLLSPLKKPLSPEVIAKLNWKIISTEPGDTLFFGSYIPHYSNANNSNRTRRMAFLTYMPSRCGDHREAFFQEKRKRQPSIDERESTDGLVRDEFGKLIFKTKEGSS